MSITYREVRFSIATEMVRNNNGSFSKAAADEIYNWVIGGAENGDHVFAVIEPWRFGDGVLTGEQTGDDNG